MRESHRWHASPLFRTKCDLGFPSLRAFRSVGTSARKTKRAFPANFEKLAGKRGFRERFFLTCIVTSARPYDQTETKLVVTAESAVFAKGLRLPFNAVIALLVALVVRVGALALRLAIGRRRRARQRASIRWTTVARRNRRRNCKQTAQYQQQETQNKQFPGHWYLAFLRAPLLIRKKLKFL